MPHATDRILLQMRSLAAFISGRRTKWLVPLVWILLLVVFIPLGAKLTNETNDETSSFLPSSAESTEVTHPLNTRFASGQTVNGIVVYRRPGGLAPKDRQKIAADARRIAAELPLIGHPVTPFQGPGRGLVAPNGELAYTTLTFRDDYKKLGDWGKKVRDRDRKGGRRAEGIRDRRRGLQRRLRQ